MKAYRYVVIPLKLPNSIGFIKHGISWCVVLFLPLSGSLGTLYAHKYFSRIVNLYFNSIGVALKTALSLIYKMMQQLYKH